MARMSNTYRSARRGAAKFALHARRQLRVRAAAEGKPVGPRPTWVGAPVARYEPGKNEKVPQSIYRPARIRGKRDADWMRGNRHEQGVAA